ADDLPPDPTSEDGFQNSSEILHLSPTQLRAYYESARKALNAATVRGDQPAPVYWSIDMDDAAQGEWGRQNGQIAGVRKNHAKDPKKLEEELKKLRNRFAKRPGGAHYESLVTGRLGGQTWHYNGAKFAWAPTDEPPVGESSLAAFDPEGADHVAVIPRGRGLIVELGEKIPDEGTLLVRVLASRADASDTTGASSESAAVPSLALDFGWRASNDSRAVVRVSEADLAVNAPLGAPEIYEFRVPIPEISPRNWVRKTAKLGGLPSPSEYIKLVNAALSGGALHVHHVEVTAPVYAAWPPASHRLIFPERAEGADEMVEARRVLASFLPRAWRRAPTTSELAAKVALFERLRGDSSGDGGAVESGSRFEAAMIEVLAASLTAPQFLYVGLGASSEAASEAAPDEVAPEPSLAARLATFLWCSAPDEELRTLESTGALADPEVIATQVERMLEDPRADRFSRHFVRQWLNLSLLDYLQVDKKAYPKYSASLKASMAEEPVAFFSEVLKGNLSVLEFLHSDFTMADERLAKHYGIEGVTGNHFRRVSAGDQPARGGLLAQAGLLAMNSDGTDSHPLKRGVWMLERILNDPPPPPPPAVPEIDLADPEIAKMTLKERIEDHRNDPACISCHAKIDPWGLAFENFDAVGSWRTEVKGRPVDSASTLFNGQELDGLDGLKRFLIENRQDQFVRALVHKLTAFALGRPLSFEDRAAVDGITAEVRKRGDGLATMVTLIAASDLFRSR
ncbi:MAG: DUF1592 domain-containing protein, partial [Planctomycetota bacterium]